MTISQGGVGDGGLEFDVAAVEGDCSDGPCDVVVVVSCKRSLHHFFGGELRLGVLCECVCGGQGIGREAAGV